MVQKRQLGPCVTFFPQPTTLISSVDAAGNIDIMTASWAGIVSKTPPTMAVSLNRGRKTYEQIRATGAFVVNMVPASLAVQADYCGLRSGRTEEKARIAGLTPVEARQVPCPLIAESPLNVECRVVGEVELGDYRLILGEILEVHADEAAFDASGAMDARVFDPLVYLGGIREYWGLGEKAADAYQAGKQLFSPAAED
jgi:flavin reductase (DIM6/NTAB) family NADH-FMN oxidoreductase RutF